MKAVRGWLDWSAKATRAMLAEPGVFPENGDSDCAAPNVATAVCGASGNHNLPEKDAMNATSDPSVRLLAQDRAAGGGPRPHGLDSPYRALSAEG